MTFSIYGFEYRIDEIHSLFVEEELLYKARVGNGNFVLSDIDILHFNSLLLLKEDYYV